MWKRLCSKLHVRKKSKDDVKDEQFSRHVTSGEDSEYVDGYDSKYLFCSELIAIIYKAIGVIPKNVVAK
jgi:hypothetical protein